MKIPSLHTIAKVVRMVPVVKDLLPNNNNESESSLLKIIKNQEDALHDKKAEICKLRENIKELEQVIVITHDELKDAQNKLIKGDL